jgi:hypothetical protein
VALEFRCLYETFDQNSITTWLLLDFDEFAATTAFNPVVPVSNPGGSPSGYVYQIGGDGLKSNQVCVSAPPSPCFAPHHHQVNSYHRLSPVALHRSWRLPAPFPTVSQCRTTARDSQGNQALVILLAILNALGRGTSNTPHSSGSAGVLTRPAGCSETRHG